MKYFFKSTAFKIVLGLSLIISGIMLYGFFNPDDNIFVNALSCVTVPIQKTLKWTCDRAADFSYQFEEKEKLKVTDNLSELDAKSAEELVKEGKKGITAEFNGIISKADIKQGAAVTQGMELFTIENTDKASVDVTLSKYDYNTVKEGQSVEITLGDNTYQGTVTKMSHIAVQNEKGTPVISATVSIDNPDEDIFLGVDAKVKIYAASAKNVVTLPVEVVNIGKEGSFCYVIEDGLVTKRNITTGISSEDYVEITDGIKEGEEVIADLGDYTEGMEVQAVPEQTGEDADE